MLTNNYQSRACLQCAPVRASIFVCARVRARVCVRALRVSRACSECWCWSYANYCLMLCYRCLLVLAVVDVVLFCSLSLSPPQTHTHTHTHTHTNTNTNTLTLTHTLTHDRRQEKFMLKLRGVQMFAFVLRLAVVWWTTVVHPLLPYGDFSILALM